jgi:ribonuclease E
MQVETTSAPVATAGEPTAPSAPHPSRRRARPQVSEVQEPLVQVETQAK